MRLGEGQKLVTFTKVAREDEAAEEAEILAETAGEAEETAPVEMSTDGETDPAEENE